MDCNAFRQRLDDGKTIPANDPEGFLAHARTCPDCSKARQRQEQGVAALRSLTPDARTLEHLERSILQHAVPQTRSWPWIAVAAGLLLLGVALFGLARNRTATLLDHPPAVSMPVPMPVPTRLHRVATLRGEVRLLENAASRLLTGTEAAPAPIHSGELLEALPGHTADFLFPPDRALACQGTGTFSLSENGFSLIQGTVRLVLARNGRGFQIRMPQALLGIRGTILRLQATPETEEVFLEEGEVEWQDLRTGLTGILHAGERRHFGPAHPPRPSPSEPVRETGSATAATPAPGLPESAASAAVSVETPVATSLRRIEDAF